ncbi:MAG: hypothetical protein E7304_06355 [Butyrivibrio sp.]|nr:hypothetical protein [Butyrivibrio sp.]
MKMKVRHYIKKIISLGLCVSLFMSMVSCGGSSSEDEELFKVYYINQEETGIISKVYNIEASEDDAEGIINELLEVLKTDSDKLEYVAPIKNITLSGYSLKDKILTLNFGRSYNELGRTIEILNRAAIVRTFSQLDFIDYVSFQIEGTPLTDHYGNIIGNMSADQFIYNVGNEINTYEKIELKLYFANETGDKLVPVYRSVVYNSNISMERLVVEQVIGGPNTNIAFPTINKDCKLNSISIKDGVCYVDFDSAFLTQPNNVTAEVALYSVVNSIVEFSNVNKVVLSVNGELTFTYMDFIISGSYERNLDIIE